MTVERGLSTVMLLLVCAVAPAVVRGRQPPPWAGPLETANIALARGDVSGAVAAWHEGYGVALRTRTWQGLVETAEAYLQIAEAGSFRASARPMARQIYLNALTRAKAQRSVEGLCGWRRPSMLSGPRGGGALREGRRRRGAPAARRDRDGAGCGRSLSLRTVDDLAARGRDHEPPAPWSVSK
jgi:hypothetical protein